MRSAKNFLLTVSLLALTGCPYTEGCDAADSAGSSSGTSGTTPAPDGGTGEGGGGEDGGGVALGPILPNCQGLTAKCGPTGESCCAAANVPGGSFNRINNASFPATVSDFRLDVYEVTVGRFRAFVNAGKGTKLDPPAPGAGAHPKIPNSGWRAEFNAGLTDDKFRLLDAIKCDPSLYDAYSETPGVNDTLPMNCTTWYEAFAFCAWDGGRLPTETEWNYAAAGGIEQRLYPWGSTMPDKQLVSFGCQSGDSIADPGAPLCTFADYTPVGTHPTGKGKWGHQDMSGNVWERVLDAFADPFRITPCNDCADLGPEGKGIRGGSINWGADFQRTSDRTAVNQEPLETRTNTVGIRCARAFVP